MSNQTEDVKTQPNALISAGNVGAAALTTATSPVSLALPACTAPNMRTPPQFVLPLRRPIVLKNLLELKPETGNGVQLACVPISSIAVAIALDARFDQIWNLEQLMVGDLASTMGLAPREQLTLEFAQSQRRVLDKSTLQSTEQINSDESTTSDTEALNATRATSQTEGWHVDTTGTLTCGYASLSVSGGYSKSVTDSNTATINHVTQATQKSARSLRSLHKIEVRGVTETIVQNRMTRTIRNPYFDRTLALNVFQLLKRYTITTQLQEIRIALVLPVVGLRFDTADFVLNNIDFLRDNLLDTTLQDDIELAIAGASTFDQASLQAAKLVAERALYHLFENPNIFNVPNPTGGPNPNDPATSFNATVGGMDKDNGRSGLRDAIRNHFETIIGTLAFYYALYKDPLYDRSDAQNVIRMADSLSAEVKAKVTSLWKDFRADNGEIVNVMDDSEYTEALRRIWGFMTAVENMLRPLLGPAAADAAAAATQLKARQTFQRLTKHLECNGSYYTQRFLRYIADRTNNQAIVDLASSALQKLGNALPTSSLLSFDTDRVFIDKNQIILPGLTALSADDLVKVGQLILKADSGVVAPPTPIAVQVDVPADGVHLEVAPGACVLPNVPERQFDLNLTLGGVNLGVTLVDQSKP